MRAVVLIGCLIFVLAITVFAMGGKPVNEKITLKIKGQKVILTLADLKEMGQQLSDYLKTSEFKEQLGSIFTQGLILNENVRLGAWQLDLNDSRNQNNLVFTYYYFTKAGKPSSVYYAAYFKREKGLWRVDRVVQGEEFWK